MRCALHDPASTRVVGACVRCLMSRSSVQMHREIFRRVLAIAAPSALSALPQLSCISLTLASHMRMLHSSWVFPRGFPSPPPRGPHGASLHDTSLNGPRCTGFLALRPGRGCTLVVAGAITLSYSRAFINTLKPERALRPHTRPDTTPVLHAPLPSHGTYGVSAIGA